MFKFKSAMSVQLFSSLMLSYALMPCAQAQSSQLLKVRYAVSITNVTHAQPFGLPLLVVHDPSMSVFKEGAPASAELQALAEEGNNQPLAQALSKSDKVQYVMADSKPLLPGEGKTYYFEATPGSEISVLGMMGTTNDTFGAAVHLPLSEWSKYSVMGKAYDAGTERNSELCMYIPGPPCNHPGSHDPAPAEGSVQLSTGIHGIGDLPSAMFNWNTGPIAIYVTRDE